jgi:hypothetical protein
MIRPERFFPVLSTTPTSALPLTSNSIHRHWVPMQLAQAAGAKVTSAAATSLLARKFLLSAICTIPPGSPELPAMSGEMGQKRI